MFKTLALCALAVAAIALSACAGRDPELIDTVQAQDQTASCTQIRAEIQANNIKIKRLAVESQQVVRIEAEAADGWF
jgi:hypothetical protein